MRNFSLLFFSCFLYLLNYTGANNDIFTALFNHDTTTLINLLKAGNNKLHSRNCQCSSSSSFNCSSSNHSSDVLLIISCLIVAEGNTPLLSAIKLGHIDALRLIISYGGDIEDMTNEGSLKGMNSLMWACSQGKINSLFI